MKKFVKLKNKFGRKTLIAGAVSLLLIGQLAIGNTISWIEDVSQVKFSTQNDAQQTPVNISGMNWKSDAIMKKGEGLQSVSLGEYFNKSGDMHLSPCYSDGENFYFPVQQSVGKTDVAFRAGTKDDANVNYLSATFRIQSAGANTAYWFEKSGENHDTNFVTFKDQNVVTATDPQTFMPSEYKTAEDATNLSQYLRFSVTVDGATIVYALNSSGEYYTLNAAGTAGKLQTNGRSVEKYTYYQETLNDSAPEESYKDDNNKDKPNQGAGENLNGNTLFTVNKYDSSNKNTAKTVTVKIWLEYDPDHSTSDANLAAINMNLVSSWAKERRIYVKDATVNQTMRTQAKWLSHDGTNDNVAGLFWVLKDNPDVYYQLKRVDDSSDYYFADIPAVYNNEAVKLSRRSSKSWESAEVWDEWETTFPNTFHSETFTVYTTEFGTWDPASDVHHYKFVSSAGVEEDAMTLPFAYMWDSSTDMKDAQGKRIGSVVENAVWPGTKMTKLNETFNGKSVFTFYYNSKYNSSVVNDGRGSGSDSKGYQSQDINAAAHEDEYFDMASLKWYAAADTRPTYTLNYLRSNVNQESGHWAQTNFVHGGGWTGTSGDNELCRLYVKSDGDYQFQLKIETNNNGTITETYYGKKDGTELPENSEQKTGINWTLENIGGKPTTDDKNIHVSLVKGLHQVYLKFVNNEPQLYISYQVDAS